MGTYKVPQNVEAQDKIVGPFTFRQLLYLFVTAILVFLGWLFLQIHIGLALITVPFILGFGLLGVYRREDQTAESYLLAALNYIIKPRKRLWGAEGPVETVRITAPKKAPTPPSKNLASEQGQLEHLAHVLDTRGWSEKQPALTLSIEGQQLTDDERLLVPHYTQPAESTVEESDDEFDTTSPNFTHYQELTEIGKAKVKEDALKHMKAATKAHPVADEPLPAVHYDPYPSEMGQVVIEPGSGERETREQAHHHTTHSKTHAKPAIKHAQPADVLERRLKELANNDDVSVEQIARNVQNLSAGQEISLRT